MMHMRITLPETPTAARQDIARHVTECVARILDLQPDNRRRITVQFDPIPTGCLAQGGELITNGKARRKSVYRIDVHGPALSMRAKQELIREMTLGMAQSLELERPEIDNVVVTFHEVTPENVGVGGELLAELVG